MAEALKTNSTLTILYLTNNQMEEKGSQALSEALKTNSTLTILNLSNNQMGEKEIRLLSEALKTNSTLTTLDLEDNSIGSKGAQTLSEELTANSTLTTLKLTNNSISSGSGTLPARWEKCLTLEGGFYYVDHNIKSTSWREPKTSSDCPQDGKLEREKEQTLSGAGTP